MFEVDFLSMQNLKLRSMNWVQFSLDYTKRVVWESVYSPAEAVLFQLRPWLHLQPTQGTPLLATSNRISVSIARLLR